MTLKIAQRIARGHPVVLTVVLLICFAVQFAVAVETVTPIARGILMAAPIGAMCLWWWAILVVARNSSGQPGSGRWDWLFAMPPLLALIAGLAAWSTENSPTAYALFALIFILLTMSAKALEKADASNGDPSVGRMLATFLLMYLSPVGVWVLRPKINRVTERTRLVAQTQPQT